ncbi:hypothetical protein [Tessaracoccus caeni]|uniref:hypothetical protein n=1 Tax=Tessaracoccus caeni TaxID=3031239 RepID=UPI0023DB4593|nr:hypothetical protein [Tessaracoccus caeni]MDF1489779.1 hypothetical protein [Tessaracoccus caeni]
MDTSRAPALLIPVAALAFVIAQLVFEHLNGGVKTHYLLASDGLPGFSNWLGLAILPLLGVVLFLRVRRLQRVTGEPRFPVSLLIPLFGSLAYGAVLATSFHLGASDTVLLVVAGLLVPIALALPVYRAEYILGFVVGMTLVFGPVIPLLIALVLALVSFVIRGAARFVASVVRGRARRHTTNIET